MQVIPAIDIMGGKVVRLFQGDPKRQTIYSDSPIAMAERWSSYGVDMIHIVDLDGAISGRLINFGVIKDIVGRIKAKVELGGGIRNEETVKKVLDAGVYKVVVGTKAMDDRFFSRLKPELKDSVVVGIDARDGKVHTKGWLFRTDVDAIDFARKMESLGVKTINYTDISKDGTLEGPSIDHLSVMLKTTKMDVIASGGVSNINDVKALKTLEKDGLKGVIIGKALYEKTIDLAEAIRICSQNV